MNNNSKNTSKLTADFIIIGAGMAGASVAAHLAEHGKVLVLEAENQLGYHSTSRSAAMFIQNYGSEILRALNQHSLKIYRHLERELGESLLKPRGELIVAGHDETEKFDAYLNQTENLQPLSINKAMSYFPALREQKICKAAIEREASDIDVDRLLQHYVHQLKARAGELRVNSKVTGLCQKNALWHVKTTSGEYSAPNVVNAAGAWADVIAKMANISPVNLVPMRRSVALVKMQDYTGIDAWPVVVSISESWYAKPQSGLLLISPADEDPVEPHDAWPEDIMLAEGIHRCEQFIDIDVQRIESSWAGLRTFAKDRNPVVGYSHESKGFFWLAGQGGYGIQIAPMLAQLSCDLILEQTPKIPAQLVSALSPGRSFG